MQVLFTTTASESTAFLDVNYLHCSRAEHESLPCWCCTQQEGGCLYSDKPGAKRDKIRILKPSGQRSALAVAVPCGSQPAGHVNMSLTLGVWDISGTTCILKLNTCFTRSGQMVLHAQKWHLQGHIGSVWQSQELKPDLPSANPVP